MFGRKGNTLNNAIVLDDEEPEELDLVDLSDYQPPAKATPIPKVEVKINVPCDDDVRIYGEEFTKSVQSLAGAVARHNKDQRTFQASASPIQNPKGLSAYKAGHENHRSGHDGQCPRQSQVPTARMDSLTNRPVSTSWTILGECPPMIESKDNQKAIECLPAIVKPEADRRPSVASQVTEKTPKNMPSSAKEPNVKKSGTLAQRMNLPSLPVVTNNHSRPMGFAAMLSAQDDPRYAAPHAAKDGETRNPANKTSTANGVPKSISPVPPKAIVASSPPCKSVAKPRPNKAPTKNTDTPQPTLDILKSNRKRPLSEMGIYELFTPGQVISNSVWEARKRQRIEKKQNRALANGIGLEQVQQEAGISSIEVEAERGKDPNELPRVVEFSDYDAAEFRTIGAVQVQDTNDTTPSEVPEMWNSPLEVPGTTGPSPANIPENINDQATNLPESCVTEQTSTDKPGPKPDKIYNTQLNSEQEVADLGRLKSIIQGPIESRQPASDRPKNVRFEEPKPSAKKPAPDKQVPPNFEHQPQQPVTIEEPPPIQESTPSTRPTTGGKGISEATLAAWRAAEAEDSVDEQEEDLIAVTESTYNYHVHRREWLIEDPEGEANAEEQLLGPYHTLQEANAVATREIRHPIQLGTSHSMPSSAWDYSFRQDHDGLQTQVAEAVGVHIEAEVSREPAPPTNRPTFPPSAFKIPTRIYLVQELSWSPISSPTPTPTPSPLCETITHACCTTLTLANKKAAEQWLEAYTGAWSDFHAEGRRKDEVERGLKFDLQEMREGREGFHREVVFEGGGMCKIWVVGCEVEGARN